MMGAQGCLLTTAKCLFVDYCQFGVMDDSENYNIHEPQSY